MLKALAAIRTRGLSESESTNRATDEFRQATDPLAVWLYRKTVLHPDAVAPLEYLYREYCRNCAEAGRPTISKTAIDFAGCHRVLKAIGFKGWLVVDLDIARQGPRASYERCGAYIVNRLESVYA